MIDDERFFAWLDGELDPAESAAVAAAVERDPALRAKAARHRAMAQKLQRAFAPLTAEPVALPNAAVIDIASARPHRTRHWWQEAAALAATLVLGLVIGTRFAAADSPVAAGQETLVAAAGLDRMLDRQLASATAARGDRVGLTFRDSSGRICRTFSASTANGLACREGDAWKIEALLGSGEGQGGEFRMAAGHDPRLAELIDEMIDGEPFGAAQERAARERGWVAP